MPPGFALQATPREPHGRDLSSEALAKEDARATRRKPPLSSGGDIAPMLTHGASSLHALLGFRGEPGYWLLATRSLLPATFRLRPCFALRASQDYAVTR